MKALVFALRNTREILRDRLNLAFGLGFPVVLLLLMTAIQHNIPVDLFRIETLAPGIAVFGLSFLSLFSGMLIAKDWSGSLMQRLLTSPMSAGDFILGYTAPLLPMAVLQSVFCLLCALFLGLRWSLNLWVTVAVLVPAALVYIAIGLLCGSVLSDKQVSGVCGALLTNVSAWLSGTWFDLELVGGTFRTVADALPFSHAVGAARAAAAGDFGGIWPHLAWVLGYAAVLMAAAVLLFLRKMRRN